MRPLLIALLILIGYCLLVPRIEGVENQENTDTTTNSCTDNDQICAMQSQFATLQAQVKKNENDIDTLKSQVDDNTSTIKQAQSELGSLADETSAQTFINYRSFSA